MIVVVTTKEKDERTGFETIVASHGVDFESGQTVVLPGQPPARLGAVLHQELGEYVILSPSDTDSDRGEPLRQRVRQ